MQTAAGGAFPESEPSAELVVVNRTGQSIWRLNASAGHGHWGRDMLTGGLLPGEATSWLLAPGIYHLRVETGDGNQLHHFGVPLEAGNTVTWTVTRSEPPPTDGIA